MARRKKQARARPEDLREDLVGIRCRADWKDWLQRFADRERLTITDIVDLAVARYAAEREFDPPPRR